MDEDREDFWGLYILLREGLQLVVNELWDYPNALEEEAVKLLKQAHPKAYLLGKRIAGYKGEEKSFEREHLDYDVGRLAVLVGAIKTSEVSKAETLRRMNMYAYHLVGVANRGWLSVIDNNELLYWNLGDAEEHCEDCPQLARQSPHRAADIPTMPGLLDTSCGVYCHCTVSTSDGRESLTLIGERL